MKHIKKINEKIEPKNTRIVLTEEDFTTLVSGGVVDKDGVKIILQDIGYTNMMNIIAKADGLI
jgi:uncharacterized protein (DUF39 family)